MPELVDLLVKRLAQAAHARAAHLGHTHLLSHCVDLSRGDPVHPHLADCRGQCRVGSRPSGHDVIGKVGPLPELGDLEGDSAYTGVERAFTVAVSAGVLLPAQLAGLLIHHGVQESLQQISRRPTKIYCAVCTTLHAASGDAGCHLV